MTPFTPSRHRLIPLLMALLLSGCSKEAVTDPKGLVSATSGCFQASFSHAKNLYANDLEKANQDFNQELYRCMAWNLLGGKASDTEKKNLSDLLREKCPFPGLEVLDKKGMVWCLMEEAAPFVQKNHDRLFSGQSG
ncbi:MAG: hypothetical protein HQL72_09700 [Magnetococcales bacterium]|nr:hypothetical protein [Magnetococcales bacterium]